MFFVLLLSWPVNICFTVEDSEVLWQIVIAAFHVQLCQRWGRHVERESGIFFFSLFKLATNKHLEHIETINNYSTIWGGIKYFTTITINKNIADIFSSTMIICKITLAPPSSTAPYGLNYVKAILISHIWYSINWVFHFAKDQHLACGSFCIRDEIPATFSEWGSQDS